MLINSCTVSLKDCPRNIVLGLDPMQIDTLCVHVFKSEARSINKVQEMPPVLTLSASLSLEWCHSTASLLQQHVWSRSIERTEEMWKGEHSWHGMPHGHEGLHEGFHEGCMSCFVPWVGPQSILPSPAARLECRSILWKGAVAGDLFLTVLQGKVQV